LAVLSTQGGKKYPWHSYRTIFAFYGRVEKEGSLSNRNGNPGGSLNLLEKFPSCFSWNLFQDAPEK